MRSALVGHTGLVGSNLKRQTTFTDLYASENGHRVVGPRFDLVVFSAARAEKWRANRDPDVDRRHVQDLCRLVENVSTERFALISTVDVYADPLRVDERTPVEANALQPYGRHRAELEACVRRHHPGALIVRLPALFGPGLKKNAVYDLLNDHRVDQIDARASFQFYDLRRLWADLERAHALGLELLNVCSAPITVADVAREAFGRTLDTRLESPPPAYDVRSVHADAWRGHNYLYTRDQVLDDLRTFVRESRVGP